MGETGHDRNLADAFDGQAADFERAPVQSDPAALKRLVREAAFPDGARLLDAGCGPGLVSAAFLEAGYRVEGVDLSNEMIERARKRCAFAGDRAQFRQASIFEPGIEALAPFDGAVSRYVIHHMLDPERFLERQVELLKPGGVLVACDHITSPSPEAAEIHRRLEVGRDRTHTNNLSSGRIVDLFAAAGLVDVSLHEEAFTLDFDEWFDRGTPTETKADFRASLIAGVDVRGFTTTRLDDQSIQILCIRAIVRGVKPGPT
ncbi:MAG: methyltransferase domain-containing protein [Paludisphaera borealis]|uniref:class I SAM-dependent methyltransferase n=1 Tax=Paludisphaera borealis TaxID=1387353 RepID=UPI0028485528|nr:methyltransferase domain-containing protein [Paludisphaera borealis]MDR3622066.1 methyltransferase domain-containing protein [Paludisphaera borealis]